MLRFVLGFVIALASVAGFAYLYLGKAALTDSCLDRCAEGTRCASAHCIPSFVDKTPAKEDKTSHRRRHTQIGNNGVTSAEPEKKLQPGDDKMSTTGDALGRPEHLDLSKPDEKELTQADIDHVWSSVEPACSRCITDALGDWPLESGKLEVSYRIERDGSVKKIRLTAPQLLLRNGLYACMKGKITALHFPASGAANVVTFPFQIQ